MKRMDSVKRIKRSHKSADGGEYYKLKDKQAKAKITYFVVRGVTFRSIIIFFILFNLIVSYYYNFKSGWITMIIVMAIN